MAGAVRELIAKVKFQIDQASLSQVNKTLQEVKKNLASISDKSLKVGAMADTSKAQIALKDLKRQADNVATTTSNIKIGAETSKAQGALKNIKASFDGISKDKKILVDANTAKANEKLKSLKVQADNVSATTSNIKIGADVSNANAALKGIKNNIASIGKEKSVTISADTGKTENALKNVKVSFDSISKEKKILFDANTDKANAKLNKLKTTLDTVKDKTTNVKVNADTNKATNALQRLKRAISDIKANVNAKFNVDSGNANSVLSRIKAQLNSLSGKVTTAYVEVKQKGKAVGEGVKKTGKALADNGGTIAATGAAMVAPLALPINTAMDFEAAMSKVKAITNSTDADMKRLTETARDLGKSTQFSATEAAQAMSYLGMAGWKTEQIIAGMPGLLDLAAASGEDLARVADIVSDDLTAFKMPAEQAAHMADVMAAASTNANTNVSMMGETFKYAGSIAGALGYSLEDVALATGLMANSGIKAEMAGTALRSIMNRMIDPPKDAAESLAQLGVSAKNADGTVKPFRQQLIELRNAMAGLTDAQKAEMAGNIAGTEAMSGFLAVISASDADFAKMAGAVDNADGAAAKMAKTMNDNAKGALKALKSALEDVAITIGNTFLEEIAGATGGVTDFIRKIGDFAKAHPKLVAGIVAFVAAAGSLLVILGGIGLALSGVMTAVGALGPVFGAIGGVLSAGFAPILAIIAAVAAAIYFVSENWDMVVEMFKPGLEIMKDGLQQLAQAWEALQPLIQALTPLIKFLANLIGGVIVAALAVLFAAASTVFNAIASFINWVCGLLGEMGSIIQWCADLLGGLISKAMDFIGLKGQIGDINTDTTNRLFDEGRAGNNYTQSQYNNFNLTAANQLQPAMAAANSGIGEWR